ncbi:hypothetical protein MKW98_001003 [Papaver atlanticum]|uniref:Uncharacterized protein n=1 Tax=Papaver atlanticum TaxID=357466 RepID=A0AAD4SDE5_9MAGN|nr:hypothetical protein MKW98_001003 [Papaver atlanticum]
MEDKAMEAAAIMGITRGTYFSWRKTWCGVSMAPATDGKDQCATKDVVSLISESAEYKWIN